MATIPESACTALYCLSKLARLTEGEVSNEVIPFLDNVLTNISQTVFILSAASAVGQLACQIARQCQANVFNNPRLD